MKARLAALAAATALSHGSATAQGLETWNADASGTLSETEFVDGFGAVANVVEFRGWRSLRALTQP